MGWGRARALLPSWHGGCDGSEHTETRDVLTTHPEGPMLKALEPATTGPILAVRPQDLLRHLGRTLRPPVTADGPPAQDTTPSARPSRDDQVTQFGPRLV